MNRLNIYKTLSVIALLLIICSLQVTAQVIISETAGTTTTITVAGGEIFADPNDGTNGGVGGDCNTVTSISGNPGNYPNCNCVTRTTLTAPPGQQVSVTFNQFRVNRAFDWLAIFDGNAPVSASNGSATANNPSSTNPLLWNSFIDGDELVDMLLQGSVTFTSTNGSLTFASRFSGVVNTCGWEADVALCAGSACPQPLGPSPVDAFVTTWEVAANDTITIPLQNGTYDFDYAWEHLSDTASINGTHTNADGDFTTNFVEPGTYRLTITGQFPHLKNYPVDKLLEVLQWGNIQWGNMESMFFNWQGTGFLATDAPDLSQVTNMRKIFANASNFNENLNHWDVSNITNMGEIFVGASNFNGNINNWDVSNVTFFFRAFDNALSFNQDISDWDVSSVNNMEEMFDNADSFNRPIGNWDVSNVGNFKRMLAGMAAFNQPLGNWKFKSNADFNQFASGTNSMSCQNYSSTILGWNFNNPDVQNLNLGGFNADYDATASRARDELIARGWSMSAGNNIGGDCGTFYEFPCTDSLALGPDTLFGNLTLKAEQLITLDSIVIDTLGVTNCTSGEGIVMTVGFQAIEGSDFTAQIAFVDCTPSGDTINLQISSNNNTNELAFLEEKRQAELDHQANLNKTETESSPTPKEKLSFQVFPNPFEYEAQLEFYLPEQQQVTIQLIDPMGRVVQTILPPQTRDAGKHRLEFTNKNNLNGLFFIVIKTATEQQVEKVMMSAN